MGKRIFFSSFFFSRAPRCQIDSASDVAYQRCGVSYKTDCVIDSIKNGVLGAEPWTEHGGMEHEAPYSRIVARNSRVRYAILGKRFSRPYLSTSLNKPGAMKWTETVTWEIQHLYNSVLSSIRKYVFAQICIKIPRFYSIARISVDFTIF